MSVEAVERTVEATDGHRFSLHARIPTQADRALLWLPALGVAARHYLPFAEALAAHGVATFVHEWRGHGSSGVRASRRFDWGYRELLEYDLAASEAAIDAMLPRAARIAGGHSLGGQLACCRLALARGSAEALWLVASGAPYWRAFPARTRWLLPPAYQFLPWLARRRGALPGHEARGVIVDWARTGLSGTYAAPGLEFDLEAALTQVDVPVDAIVLARDWLGPESSLRFLLSKMSPRALRIHRYDEAVLGARADHFSWMQRPRAVASALAGRAHDRAG
jgi:predicted alpha/beta hydrolase